MELLDAKSALKDALDLMQEGKFDLECRLENSEKRTEAVREQHMQTTEDNVQLHQNYENLSEDHHLLSCDFDKLKFELACKISECAEMGNTVQVLREALEKKERTYSQQHDESATPTTLNTIENLGLEPNPNPDLDAIL